MSVSAATAANIMLDAAEERGLALDPMKLQKLLYLTNGYYLALSGNEWINDSFEAWKYGPVIPSLYHYFKSFGATPIKAGTRMNSVFSTNTLKNDQLFTKALNFVLDKYGSKSGVYLSELTHKVNSPWHKTKAAGTWNDPISKEDIQKYYSNFVSNPINA